MGAFAAVRAGNHSQFAGSESVTHRRAARDDRDCLKGFCGGTEAGPRSDVAKASDNDARRIDYGDESAMARLNHRAARDFDQSRRRIEDRSLIARLIHGRDDNRASRKRKLRIED